MASKWFFTPFRLPETQQPVGCIVDDQANLIIAEVYELEGVNNGPLMASAPELLDALKALRSFMWKEGYADQRPAMALADAVIAKAEDSDV